MLCVFVDAGDTQSVNYGLRAARAALGLSDTTRRLDAYVKKCFGDRNLPPFALNISLHSGPIAFAKLDGPFGISGQTTPGGDVVTAALKLYAGQPTLEWTVAASVPFDACLLKPYRQSQSFNALSRVATLPGHSGLGTLAPGASLNASQKHRRILVADNNAINLKVALAMLAKLGYDTAVAHNGREAADLVSQSLSSLPDAVPFAAVLMDFNMPVMDSLEASRFILSMHGSSTPPLIALTASVLEDDRQRCMDAGMVAF